MGLGKGLDPVTNQESLLLHRWSGGEGAFWLLHAPPLGLRPGARAAGPREPSAEGGGLVQKDRAAPSEGHWGKGGQVCQRVQGRGRGSQETKGGQGER